jgi:hypothetical protein
MFDILDRVSGRTDADVFARLEAGKKRMNATRAARDKFKQKIARDIKLMRLHLGGSETYYDDFA